MAYTVLMVSNKGYLSPKTSIMNQHNTTTPMIARIESSFEYPVIIKKTPNTNVANRLKNVYMFLRFLQVNNNSNSSFLVKQLPTTPIAPSK